MKWATSLVLMVVLASAAAYAGPPPPDASVKLTGELVVTNWLVPGDALYQMTATYTLPVNGGTYQWYIDYFGSWTGGPGGRTVMGWGNGTWDKKLYSVLFGIGIVGKELGGDPDATTKTYTYSWLEYVPPDTKTTCVRFGVNCYDVDGTLRWFVSDTFEWTSPWVLRAFLADNLADGWLTLIP